MDKKQPSPGDWAMMAGGLVVLIGSFLDAAGEENAWGDGAFPLATLIVIYAFGTGVLVALTRFANVKLPGNVLGFTWNQIYLVLGFFAALMALFWIPVPDDTGIGLWIMLLGSLAVVAGAVMNGREQQTPGTLS